MKIKAAHLVELMGEKLIGYLVKTIPYGDWPGGPAKVMEMGEKDSDISFYVRHQDKKIQKQFGFNMGVFEHEPIELLGKP